MFIGHFGVAFAAKKLVPRASLGTLFIAAQLADLLWPAFVLLGIERFEIKPGYTAVTPLEFVHYPYSHSLLAMAFWGVAFAAAYAVLRRRPVAVAVTLAALVLSHWLLDVLTHAPDMPLTLWGGPMLGLGLWSSVAGTVAIETALFAAGVALYMKTTRPQDRIGSRALAALVIFLFVVYLANVFGPPPPSVTAVAWSGFAMWLLVAWGYWVDAHRQLALRLGG